MFPGQSAHPTREPSNSLLLSMKTRHAARPGHQHRDLCARPACRSSGGVGRFVSLRTFSSRAIWAYGAQKTITVNGLPPYLSPWAPTLTLAGREAQACFLRLPCQLQHRAACGEGCPLSSPPQAARDPGPARPELPPQAWRPRPCRDSPAPFAGETGRSSPPPEPSLAVWPPWGRAGPHLTASPCGRPPALPSAQPPVQPPGPERRFGHLRTDGFLHRQLCRRGTFCRCGGSAPAPPDGRASRGSGSGTLLLLSPNTALSKTQARLSFLRQQSSKPPSAWQLLL